ncbi:MAG: phenylacetate--CoA ligase family protein, partial [Syntrophales bacterium LBB04]|nr:phenylacetate--CoA ligase family protein [Syntrophales bacterium LBB04]
IDPETGLPIQGAGSGEMVLTNLGRTCSPAIRFKTGDMVKVDESPCGCGRSFRLLDGGIIGRVDEMITIRGMNVFPSQVGTVTEKYLQIGEEYQIVACTEKGMANLKVMLELAVDRPAEQVISEIAKELRDCLEIRVEVETIAPGTLRRSDYKSQRFVDRREK